MVYGSMEHLKAIAAEVDLPVMRKDFIVDSYQLYEAKLAVPRQSFCSAAFSMTINSHSSWSLQIPSA